jgi:translation initiation factor 1
VPRLRVAGERLQVQHALGQRSRSRAGRREAPEGEKRPGRQTVTVVDGLPRNDAFLKDLCQELKRACGTGGTVVDGAVELQGDLRDRVRDVLLKKAFVVKG